ncbi:hypothetical protein HELRODRAFT_125118, partial [Helobdella robusta]|uniref:HMG box domain-containing protein n=1 Tax=Helobdella robusta TaxID=6412 RepID=T1EH43_HELRO
CKKSTNRIKRPMNAFIVWSQIERRKIAEAQPDLHNALISQQLGTRWKQMSKEKRQPYVDEANRLKELHGKEYPNYRFQPRKKPIKR